MTENIDKTITYKDAYGKIVTSFYYKGAEIDVSNKSSIDKKLQELIETNSNMLRNNPKIMRITSKI